MTHPSERCDALPADALRLGREVVAFEQDDQGAAVCLADGSLERADFIIGADGIRSRTRAAIGGAEDLSYAGYTAWRAVVPLSARLSSTLLPGESWDRGALLGSARLQGSQVYWWASIRTSKTARRSPQEEKTTLLERFGGWHPPIPALIEATPPEAIIRTPLYERPRLRRWAAGRIALLGDAAHPMLPNLGQGACQAIEDAHALAEALRAEADTSRALARYAAARAGRANLIVRRSHQMARAAHLTNPLAVHMRNAVLRATSANTTLRRLEPLLAR